MPKTPIANSKIAKSPRTGKFEQAGGAKTVSRVALVTDASKKVIKATAERHGAALRRLADK